MSAGDDRRRLVYAAATAVVVWSGGFWAVRDVRGLPTFAPPSLPSPRAVYAPLPSRGHPDQPDALAIWSPTLFAMPSPWGFSGLSTPATPLRPPLEVPPPPPPHLPRPPREAMALSAAWPPLPTPTFPPPPRDRPPPPRPTMEAMEGKIPAGTAFPLPPGEGGPLPWTAEVVAAIGDGGVPASVWVAGDVPADVRAALAPAIARWRWPAEDAGTTARFRLMYPGAPVSIGATP